MKRLILAVSFLMLITTLSVDNTTAKNHSMWNEPNVPAELNIRNIEKYDWEYKCGHLIHFDHTKKSKKIVRKTRRKKVQRRYGDYVPRKGCGWKRYYGEYYIDDAKAFKENRTAQKMSTDYIFKKDQY